MYKKNDYFLNIIANPEYNILDLKEVGLNINNTSLLPYDVYKNNDFVKNSPLFLTNGEFDESKLKEGYERAEKEYNLLAHEEVLNQMTSPRDKYINNIFVPKELRNLDIGITAIKVINPLRQVRGFQTWNIQEAPKYSEREIAEQNKIFDYNSKKFLDKTPENTWFSNFYDPKVLALWEFDADEDGNPTSDKSKIVYHKGQLKFNEDGEPYYETLGNRSVYGKQVLSGFDTLTKEGSFMNSIDFFDSDGLDKNIIGAISKTAVLIAPLFMSPYISVPYLVLRLGLNMSDIVAKVGKMVTNSDNLTFNKIEAFNKATTFSNSDYVQGSQLGNTEPHPWSIEGLLHLGSDVFLQLYEQRAIFKYLPSLLKGNTLGFSEDAQKAFIEAEKLNWDKLRKGNLLKQIAEGKDTKARLYEVYENAKLALAYDKLSKIQKSNLTLGKYLGQLYMTGIVSKDAYEEAKLSGASDEAAAWFTLLYSAFEFGLLNTGVGEHIMPELRAEALSSKNMLKTLGNLKPISKYSSNTEKHRWFNSISNLAKRAAHADFYDLLSKIGVAAVHGLGEGVEEASEEFLLDMSKLLYNMSKNIFGQDGQMDAFDNGDFSKMLNRYGLNFVGGVLGGAGSSFIPGMSTPIKSYDNSEAGIQEAFRDLVHHINAGNKKVLKKMVQNTTWASDDLSNRLMTLLDGTVVNANKQYGELSLNDEIKAKFNTLIDTVDDILTTEGVKLAPDALLDEMALPVFRRTVLGENQVAPYFVRDYVDKISKLVVVTDEINKSTKNLTDSQESKNKEEIQEKLNKLKKEKKELLEQIKEYLKDGEMAKEYNKTIAFTMMPEISGPLIGTFESYLIDKYGTVNIPENTKKLEEEEYKNWLNSTNYREQAILARHVFDDRNEKFSENIKNHSVNYFESKENDNIFDELEEFFLGDVISLDDNIISGVEGAIATLPTDVLDNVRIYLEEKNKKTLDGIARTHAFVQGVLSRIGRDPKYDSIAEELIKNYSFISSLIDVENINDLNDELKQAIVETGIKVNEDGTLDENSKNKYISDEIDRTAWNIITNKKLESFFEDALNSQKYIKLPIRAYFMNLFDYLENKFEPAINEEAAKQILSEYNLTIDDKKPITFQAKKVIKNKIKDLEEKINSKQHSNVEELLDLYLQWKGSTLKPSEFLNNLEGILMLSINNSISEFGSDKTMRQKLEEIINSIHYIASHVSAARVDNADYDNVLGYNKVLNDLDKTDLAEIDLNIGNAILQDLYKTLRHAELLLRVYSENSNLKLLEQPKIRIKLGELRYRKLLKIIVNIPDTWKGKDKLKEVLDKCTVTANLLDLTDDSKYSFSDELTVKFLKEQIEIEEAIKEFFDSNEDRDLSEVITSANFNLVSENDNVLNLNTKDIDDSSYIFWLATCQAESAKSYNKEYTTYLDSTDKKVIPVPAQEAALRNTHAFILNKKIFDKFTEAYNKLAKEQILSLDEEAYRPLYIKDKTGLDSDVVILNRNKFLVEGIPGCGKTQGFLKILVGILLMHHPKILENAAFIHTSKKYAKNSAKQAGLTEENFKAYDKKSFFDEFTEGYEEFPIDKSGKSIIDISRLEKEEGTNLWKYKANIKDTEAKPSIIFVDECTRYSQQESLLMRDIEEKYGIAEISLGDFDLIGLKGSYKFKNDDILNVRSHRNNFPRSIKMGSSLRSNNLIKDLNISKMRLLKYSTLNGDEYPELLYYEDESGIYGDKLIESGDDGSITDEFKESLKLMLDSSDSKINFIFQDTDSDLYKYLETLNKFGPYKGRIEFLTAGASQGQEDEYYIYEGRQSVDKEIEDEKLDYWLEAYTAISRATKGTLIFTYGDYFLNEFKTKKSDYLSKFEIDDEIKVKYSKKYLDLLKQALGNLDDIKIFTEDESKPNKDSGETHTEDSDVEPETLESVEELSKPYEYEINNAVNPGEDSEYNQILHSFNTNETGALVVDEDGNILEEANPEDEGNILALYGEVKEGTKKWKLLKRVDGIYGLINLGLLTDDDLDTMIVKDGKTPKRRIILTENGKKKALTLLRHLKSEGLENPNLSNIVDVYKHILHKDNLKVRFALKTNGFLKNPSTSEYRFLKRSAERLCNIFNHFKNILNNKKESIANESNKKLLLPQRHTINILVEDENQQTIFEIPLAILTSPLTMLQTKGFEDIRKIFEELCLPLIESLSPKEISKIFSSKYEQFYQDFNIEGKPSDNVSKSQAALLLLYEKIKNTDIPNKGNIINHMRFYLSQSNEILYLDDILEGRSLSGSKFVQRVTGPTVISRTGIGSDYYFDLSYLNENEWMDLAEFKRKCIGRTFSKVYTLKSSNIVDSKGNVLIAKGHPFVLVTDRNLGNVSDKQLLEYFVNQTKNNNVPRILRVYLTTVGASVLDYFRNLNLALNSDNEGKIVDRTMGNYLTVYRIAEAILKDGSNFLDTLDYKNPDDVLISRLDAWKKLISWISKKSTDDIVSILSSTGKLLISKYPELSELTKYLSVEAKSEGGTEIVEHHILINRDDKKTLKSKLNRFVRYIVLSKTHNFALYSDSSSSGFSEFNEETQSWSEEKTQKLIEAVKEDIKNSKTWNGREEILYNIPLAESGNIFIEGNEFVPNEYDSDTDSDSHGPLRVNGKIDTTNIIFKAHDMLLALALSTLAERMEYKNHYLGKVIKKQSRPSVEKTNFDDSFQKRIQNKKEFTELFSDDEKNLFVSMNDVQRREALIKKAEENKYLIHFNSENKVDKITKVDDIIYKLKVYKNKDLWYHFDSDKVVEVSENFVFDPNTESERDFKLYLNKENGGESGNLNVKLMILDAVDNIPNTDYSFIIGFINNAIEHESESELRDTLEKMQDYITGSGASYEMNIDEIVLQIINSKWEQLPPC